MGILVKNPSMSIHVEIKDLGFTVLATEYYDIGMSITDDIKSSSDLLAAIVSNALQLLNVAGVAYTSMMAIQFLAGEESSLTNPNIVTMIEFRHRFYFAERVVIDNDYRPEISTLKLDFQASKYINLSSDTVAIGLGLLVSFGLLTSARMLEIIDPTWSMPAP